MSGDAMFAEFGRARALRRMCAAHQGYDFRWEDRPGARPALVATARSGGQPCTLVTRDPAEMAAALAAAPAGRA
jgi:hypothetical protein